MSRNGTSPGVPVSDIPRLKRETGWFGENWGKLVSVIVGVLGVGFTVGGFIWKLSGDITDLRTRAKIATKERDSASDTRNAIQASLVKTQVSQAILVTTIENFGETLGKLVYEIKELRKDVSSSSRRRRRK